MDGLKTSQRKIIYSIFKKNLFKPQSPMKVAQLGGYVAEHTHYHHGESCYLIQLSNLPNPLLEVITYLI